MKNLIPILISLAITIVAIFIYDYYDAPDTVIVSRENTHSSSQPEFKQISTSATIRNISTDLVKAAAIVSPTVVFIRSVTDVDYDAWKTSYTSSTGSGVIVSSDGFIITNKHLIENGDEIEVILNDRREYKAEIIGTDKNTDLALLKIEATDLPAIEFANSKSIRVGEWVLAVGNPYKLHSTVTAGIVSAKARDIPYNFSQDNVNFYIQTDAAVNQGNSGGALVNSEGKLIGINTAILTHSGRYEGYSFAIPSNVVLKVIEDLREFGMVHRGRLGIDGITVNAELASAKGLSNVHGVYIDEILPNGAAANAGIHSGDIILSVNGKAMNTLPELQEYLSLFRPGDTIDVTIFRNGKTHQFHVKLTSKLNTTDITSVPQAIVFKKIGFEVRNLSTEERKKFNIKGVKVISIFNGSKISRTKMDPGFIITKVNDKKITDIKDLRMLIGSLEGKIVLEGVYERYEGAFWYVFDK